MSVSSLKVENTEWKTLWCRWQSLPKTEPKAKNSISLMKLLGWAAKYSKKGFKSSWMYENTSPTKPKAEEFKMMLLVSTCQSYQLFMSQIRASLDLLSVLSFEINPNFPNVAVPQTTTGGWLQGEQFPTECKFSFTPNDTCVQPGIKHVFSVYVQRRFPCWTGVYHWPFEW